MGDGVSFLAKMIFRANKIFKKIPIMDRHCFIVGNEGSFCPLVSLVWSKLMKLALITKFDSYNIKVSS